MTQALNDAPADAEVDVAIIGAGLSGIGAACHLLREFPGRRLVILEARDRSGGTWDLFRYPGIRSDSDMHTLGYDFQPWEDPRAIADGPSILRYLRATAEKHGVESLIRYRSPVRAANWCRAAQRWELHIGGAGDGSGIGGGAVRGDNPGPGRDERPGDDDRAGSPVLHARFLLVCAGYYRYDRGHEPAFPGRDAFSGHWVHPQHWPEGLDVRGKRVLVIGSGATAVTLVPALAEDAREVVMLQRSPTWMISRPRRDRIADLLRAIAPARVAYALTRWKNVLLGHWFYRRSRRRPEALGADLLGALEKQLDGAAELADFTPRYAPWDERLCLVPDGDFFGALRAGRARVITGSIERITDGGVLLEDGREIPADIIVSATGLELQLLGGMDLSIDGESVDPAARWSYRGMMLSGVPNLLSIFGYINASWTLRADLVSRWFCRLLQHMDERGLSVVRAEPEVDLPSMEERHWIDGFSPGYLRRGMHRYPRQGDREPWVNSQDYLRERKEFARMSFSEAALLYERSPLDADESAEPSSA